MAFQKYSQGIQILVISLLVASSYILGRFMLHVSFLVWRVCHFQLGIGYRVANAYKAIYQLNLAEEVVQKSTEIQRCFIQIEIRLCHNRIHCQWLVKFQQKSIFEIFWAEQKC